jgi:hypothetical protein
MWLPKVCIHSCFMKGSSSCTAASTMVDVPLHLLPPSLSTHTIKHPCTAHIRPCSLHATTLSPLPPLGPLPSLGRIKRRPNNSRGLPPIPSR